VTLKRGNLVDDARELATESASAFGRAPVSWPPVPPPEAASVENSESLPDLSHFSLMEKKHRYLHTAYLRNRVCRIRIYLLRILVNRGSDFRAFAKTKNFNNSK
jgi:hypothetical protein